MQRSLGHACAAVLTSVTLIHSRSSYTHIYRHTSMHVCLSAFLSIPDSWVPNSDSLSLQIQAYFRTCILACVCLYIFVLFLFVFLSIHHSWLPDSLFRLVTGGFFCPRTSCRSCHPTFFPGFHCLGVRVCLSLLSTEILCSSESVEFLSLLAMYLPVFFVLLACVCVCWCHGVHQQTNRHCILAPHTHIHTQTHK